LSGFQFSDVVAIKAAEMTGPGCRVIVCGGRSFYDYGMLEKYLDMLHAIHRFDLVIHGAARGADTMADNWAYSRHIDVQKYPAMWKQHGAKAAGPIRNRQMIDEGRPDLVIAFQGGNGTANMRTQAHQRGLKVIDLAGETVRALVTAEYRALKNG
jgi:hypothetical protein